MSATHRTSSRALSAERVAPNGEHVAPDGDVALGSERPVVGSGNGSSPRLQVAEMQRARLLGAAAGAVDEFGYVDATVGHITARARISRRTFYELFDNREECLAAALESVLDRVRREIAAAEPRGLSWHERIRAGLWAILSFFDREPALARLCLVQSARGSESMLQRRAEVFAQLALAIDEGRNEGSNSDDAPQLTAEGLVGAAHAIVYERVLKHSPEPLTSLFEGLMGMIVLPYLGAAAARRERSRPAPPPITPVTEDSQFTAIEDEGLLKIPMRLTYRTVRALRAIAEQPGISNRTVGDQAGISDQGQVSKLLARLQRLELVLNTGIGHMKGEPNAWRLTPAGVSVLQSIHIHAGDGIKAA